MPPEPTDEDWIIARIYRDVLPVPGVPVGIGDDAAVLANGEVLTTDTMVEGVHWDDRLDPGDVGWKLVAVNVSDLAAMGATPRWALLNLSLPAPLDRAWVEAFAEGLAAACRAYGVGIIGGDTTRAPVRVLNLTLCGHAPHPALRSGGQPGDLVMVTGELGLSAEAFLAPNPSPEALAWFRRPQPPLQFAQALAPHVHAMMDLSDGLLQDLRRLCRASGCGASIQSKQLPGDRPVSYKISFGEDYQLLFTIPQHARDAVESLATMYAIRVTSIGRLIAEGDVLLDEGHIWPSSLFLHFPKAPHA